MIKVLIVDDHPMVRMGMKRIIEDNSDMAVTAEVGKGEEVLSIVCREHFDIILLDISMPGRGGLEVLEQLKKEKPEIPVLVISMYPEGQYAIRALKGGASGYLTKTSAPRELVAAIRKVISGRKYISQTLAEKMALDLESNTDKPLHENLSNREWQIMEKISSGKTVSEIAEELSLSIKTISTYRVRILQKLGLHNNVEIARYVIKNHLID